MKKKSREGCIMHRAGNDASHNFDGQEKLQYFSCHPKANVTIYGPYKNGLFKLLGNLKTIYTKITLEKNKEPCVLILRDSINIINGCEFTAPRALVPLHLLQPWKKGQKPHAQILVKKKKKCSLEAVGVEAMCMEEQGPRGQRWDQEGLLGNLVGQ